jgi:S-DNA-T family DNA segregation ATPase FtsK/SpoIIIE
MSFDLDVIPIVEAGPFQPCVIEMEAKFSNQEKRRSRRRAKTGDRSRIVRYFRLEQCDSQGLPRSNTLMTAPLEFLGRLAEFLKSGSVDVTIAQAEPRGCSAPTASIGGNLMNRWRMLAAGGSLLTAAFVGFSVLGWNPSDPPKSVVVPANAEVVNCCGWLGAAFAGYLVELFGSAAGFAVVPVVAAALALIQSSWLARLFTVTGGAVVLAAASTVAQIAEWSFSPSPIGSGGLIGGTFAHGLVVAIGEIGSLVVLWPLLAVGMAIAFRGPFTMIARTASRAIQTLRSLRERIRLPRWRRERLAIGSIHDQEVDERFEDEEESEDADAEPARNEPSRPPLHALRINRVKVEDELPPAPILPAVPTGSSFELPGLDLLDELEQLVDDAQDDQIREQAQLMERTFAQFSMNVKVVQVDMGPVVTQYEIALEPGLRARKVIALQDDLAIALRAPSVRIIAPIPGRNTVGVEVPNQQRAKVTIREVMVKAMGQGASMRLPIYLGKDVKGLPLVCDLAQMPHLLIAGRTGTGKSVCLNTLILSILLSRTPDQVRLLMIDPKMVELSQYGQVPHLLHPVVTDMRKAEALLGWAVDKMEERYALLARVGVRHIDAFNKLTYEERVERVGEDLAELREKMPYIIVVADEMADLILTAKEVETHIIRLAQKSRAVGIHLVLATQKPTVDVITGLIKSNLPARIAFQVASRTDSMVVLDERGAEKLLGYGDMLFSSPGAGGLIRAQGTYVSDDEVTRVTEFLAEQGEPQFAEELLNLKSSTDEDGPKVDPSERDDMYLDAVEVVVREQRGSVSLLQRALGVGYGRAARLIDYMAEDGIVGPYSGSQAREVNYTSEQWEELKRQRFASV